MNGPTCYDYLIAILTVSVSYFLLTLTRRMGSMDQDCFSPTVSL